MNTKYTIKNFRIFDEDGSSIDLKPLTILTGCNSSGKSSIVKSLLLLCDYFSSLKQDKENGKKTVLTTHYLDFTKKPHNRLGKFSKIVNNKAEVKRVTFEIQVHSLMLGQDVDIELVFSGEENNFNGHLYSISVKKLDGTILYTSEAGKSSQGNIYTIFPEFVRFAYTQHYISYYQSVENDRRMGLDSNTMPDDEFAELEEGLKTHLDDLKQKYGSDVLKDINRWNNAQRWNNAHCSNISFLTKNSGKSPKMIEKVKETGILYYLPIFETHLKGDKNKCVEFLTQCAQDGGLDKASLCILNKLLSNFTSSSCNDFLSYYKEWEKKYLSAFKKEAFPSNEKSPKLFSANGLGINANKIIFAPHNTTSMEICLDDKKDDISLPQKSREEKIAEWEEQPLNFTLIYEILAILSAKILPDNHLYYNKPNGFEYMEYSSRTEYLFFKFVEAAIKEIVVDATPEALLYVSSSIINVKRLYPVEAEDEFTELLKRYMDAKRNIHNGADYIPDTFLNDWIRHFGIGKKISVDIDEEGLGITLRLHKDDDDVNGMLLADTGYGITQLFATLLNIEVAIMERKISKMIADNNISPFPFEEEKITTYSVPTIAIEEPEIHLHPAYQSMLAKMFVEAHQKYNIHFIIETHSEYLIRKLQVMVADKENHLSSNDVSLNYIEMDENANSTNRQIELLEDGRLSEPFGPGFFDEATELSMHLLKMKVESI